jgi:cold shock CspA family protein
MASHNGYHVPVHNAEVAQQEGEEMKGSVSITIRDSSETAGPTAEAPTATAEAPTATAEAVVATAEASTATAEAVVATAESPTATAEASTATAEEADSPPMAEEIPEEISEEDKMIGICKWFSDRLGYGFITVCEGDRKGEDVFVHYKGLQPSNNPHRTLRKGEYVSFGTTASCNGMQATHVTGVLGGPLLCDHAPPHFRGGVHMHHPPRSGGGNPKKTRAMHGNENARRAVHVT